MHIAHVVLAAFVLAACSSEGELPFQNGDLAPGSAGTGGKKPVVTGGSGSSTNTGGRPGSGGSGGGGGSSPASGGSAGSYQNYGGGAGFGPAYPSCPTEEWWFSPTDCDSCMRTSCCNAVQQCDDDLACAYYDSCVGESGCYDLPPYAVYECAQTSCGSSYVYYEWLSVYQCFTGTCADSCY